MENMWLVLIIVLGIPFLFITICWIVLMIIMRKTTGELKLWLTPDNVIKSLAIIFVTTSTLVLAVLKILEGGTAGAILSGIIGYTLGTQFFKEKLGGANN